MLGGILRYSGHLESLYRVMGIYKGFRLLGLRVKVLGLRV